MSRSQDIGQGEENPLLTGGTAPCMADGQQKEIIVPVSVPISFLITVPIADASVVGCGRRFAKKLRARIDTREA